MSTLPPQPARRAYTTPAATFDDDDYGTSDFLIPETPRVVFGDGKPKNPEPVTPVAPEKTVRVAAPVYAKAPVKEETPAPVPAPVKTETSKEIRPVQADPETPRPGVAVSIDNALQQAPAMIDNAIQQAPALIGTIVDHYSEQGKKDRLIANVLTGSALATLVTGVFGPMMLALPLVLSMLGLGWGRKARRNGMSTTLSSIMAWTVIGVSVSGIVIFGALVGVAHTFLT